MTKEDASYIKQDYRLCKNKGEQIHIYSQLYDCSIEEILDVLGIPWKTEKPVMYSEKPRLESDTKQLLIRDLKAGTNYRIAAKIHGVSLGIAYYYKQKFHL